MLIFFQFQGQKEKERKIVVNRLGSIRDWLREDDDEEQLSCLYKVWQKFKPDLFSLMIVVVVSMVRR